MKYDFNRLNAYEFEQLSQSLSKVIFGPGCTPFGEGPDGGREATFQGKADFPGKEEQWDGYWVIQAKFRAIINAAQASDLSWLRKEIIHELAMYQTRVNPVKQPENLIFFTNIILTASVGNGGQDQIANLCRQLEKNYGIKHIHVLANHDLQRFLDDNRDIAISFAPFILPGDVLGKLLDMLDTEKGRRKIIHEGLCKFLETEFLEDAQSKLDQAGRLTTEKVNLEKVFVDLDVSISGQPAKFRFVNQIVKLGNRALRGNDNSDRFVLKAGPGQGKSTLSQFLAQCYRAYFLRDHDPASQTHEPIGEFIKDFETLMPVVPSWSRIPFKIVLKDYAGWIRDVRNRDANAPISLLWFISKLIERKVGDQIKPEELETVIKTMPSLIIFDGLDEVPVSSNREEVINELNKFTEIVIRRLNVDALIIGTTRPQGYSKEFDSQKYLHMDIADLDKENCKIYLQRLLDNIIDNVLERENKMEILGRALDDVQVSRIMRSPLQASIMAILVKIGGEPPTNKFDLFKQYFETIFNREKQREISPILSSDKKWIVDIHYKLGLYLQAISEKDINPSGNISLSKFQHLVEEYLHHKGVELEEISKINQEIQKAAIERLVFISHVEDQKIGFAIRSLQEYFAANGYVHNIGDDVVRERIRKIAGSAYWSNTLLFIIGYLADSKIYLIDFVLSLCSELNGAGNNPDENSLNSIAKQGSWLALDILNEGIFRQDPKLENQFCNYLIPLLSIPFITKHTELTGLSQRIVDRWLIRYIEDELTANPENETCWNIIYHLSLTGKYESQAIFSYLPQDALKQFEVMSIFIKQNYIPEVFISYLCEGFMQYPLDHLYRLLENNSNRLILPLFSSLNGEKKTRLLEVLFWIYCNKLKNFTAFFELLKNLGGENLNSLIENGQTNWGSESTGKEIYISQNYRLIIEYFNPASDGIISELLSLSEKVNSTLLVNFFTYLESASYEDFTKFRIGICSYSSFMLGKVKGALQLMDGLNYYIHSRIEIEGDEFESVKNQIYELATKTSLPGIDQVMLASNYTRQYELTISELSGNILHFARQYESFKSATVTDLFIRLMNWSSNRLTASDYDVLANNAEFMSFYKMHLTSSSSDVLISNYYRIPEIMYMLEPVDFMEYLRKDGGYVYNHLVWKATHVGIYTDRDIVKLIFCKCCKAIKLQLLSGEKASYKYIFYYIKLGYFPIGEVTFLNIPFQDILEDRYLDVFGALLLLMNPDLSADKFNQISEVFAEHQKQFEDPDFGESLTTTLKYMTASKCIEEVLILLHQYVQNMELVNATLLESIKSHAQNKTSLAELSDTFDVL